MPQAIGGVAYFKIDGNNHAPGASGTFSRNRIERTEDVGIDGRIDYTETPVAAYIEGEFKMQAGLDVQTFEDVKNATITCELATGDTVTLRNAFCTGLQEVDIVGGKFTARFAGSPT